MLRNIKILKKTNLRLNRIESSKMNSKSFKMKILKWIQIDFMTFFYEIITVENVDNFLSSINLSIVFVQWFKQKYEIKYTIYLYKWFLFI